MNLEQRRILSKFLRLDTPRIAVNDEALMFQISNLKSQISNLKFQISDRKSEISDLESGIRNLESRLFIVHA